MSASEPRDRRQRRDADPADAQTVLIPRVPADPPGPPRGGGRGSAGAGGKGSRGNRVAVIAVVAVLAVAVIVGVVIALKRSSSPTADAASYPVRVDGAVVVAGQPTARTTLDVYEDMLCPICGRFESTNAADIGQALNDGQIQVRYHTVAILDNRSKPEGYSTRAANATVCAAASGIFPAYHSNLFADQPSEGSAGFSTDDLVARGKSLGANADFEQCVRGNKYAKSIGTETTKAGQNRALYAPGSNGFGTPTVTDQGKRVEVNNADWLRNAIQG